MPFWSNVPKVVEVRLKFVYYGPCGAGANSNLYSLYSLVQCLDIDVEMTRMSMEDGKLESVTSFEMVPSNFALKDGYLLKCSIFRPFGPETRSLIMNGANAVIFVADSSKYAQEANQQSLRQLESDLQNFSLSLDSIPWVIQYNKRDLPDALDVDTLNRTLNKWQVPHYEAVATESKGVVEPFDDLLKFLTENFDFNQLWIPGT